VSPSVQKAKPRHRAAAAAPAAVPHCKHTVLTILEGTALDSKGTQGSG